jgi:hypothetical protein
VFLEEPCDLRLYASPVSPVREEEGGNSALKKGPYQLIILKVPAHGIRVYVPQRLHYQRGQSSNDKTRQVVRREIERSNCVLALITNLSDTTRRALEDELNRALAPKKLVIPIVEEVAA